MTPGDALNQIRQLLRLPHGTPTEVVDELTRGLGALRRWSPRASALACPRCGTHVRWSQHPYDDVGQAHCHDGLYVTPRIPGLGPPCDWPGARVVWIDGDGLGWHPDFPGGEARRNHRKIRA